jgi:hypothetical protein
MAKHAWKTNSGLLVQYLPSLWTTRLNHTTIGKGNTQRFMYSQLREGWSSGPSAEGKLANSRSYPGYRHQRLSFRLFPQWWRLVQQCNQVSVIQSYQIQRSQKLAKHVCR